MSRRCTLAHLPPTAQVPNQPIHFLAEQPPRGRSEDAIIAYTWNHFLDHIDDPEWLLRLPMTKVCVCVCVCVLLA